MSACPSVWNKSASTGRIFMKFDIWAFVENLSENWNFIKLLQDDHYAYFTLKPVYIFIYVTHFFLEREIFQTKVVDKIKTNILLSHNFFFFRKLCRVWDNVENYYGTGLVTDENMAYALCMMDT